MKFKYIPAILSVLLFCPKAEAQFTLTTGNTSLEISGYITSFYNYRFYDKNETDKKKNRFALDYGVIRFDGITSKHWKYQLQLNAPAIFDPTTSDGFIMQSTVAYSDPKESYEIQVGYDKVPFSRQSLVSNTETPFLQRPEIARGSGFPRRDAGVTLKKMMLNKRFNIIGGCYTGLGSESLTGENDASGNMELVGRIEYNWPARYRYQEIDYIHEPIPLIAIGSGYRYADKATNTGVDYPISIIDGIKRSWNADFSIAWRGLSAHFEYIQMKLSPNDKTLLLGKPTDYFMAGGTSAQLNYYSKPLRSVFAVRYENFNPNDLIKGDNADNVSFAYNYLISGTDAILKIHYWKRLKDSDAAEVWSEDQIRLALQLIF